MNKAAQALHRLKREPGGNNCRALMVFLQEVSLARQPETPPSSSTLFPASLQHTSAVSTPLNEMAETMLSEIELGSVCASPYYRQVEMGLTLRDKWSCVIMCLYQVQAALVLEGVIWAVSLSSPHEWHAGQEARCQRGPKSVFL